MASNIPGVAYRFVVNPDGSFVLDFIGERSREILGIKNDPATFFDAMTQRIDPSVREQFFDSISQAVRNQEPWKFEGEFQKPSGEKIWIRAISNPAREGETLLFDGIIFDETAHKVTDDLVHLLIRITDDIPVSIMVHDDAGTILYANDHLFRLLGYTRDEFLAKNIRDIDAPGSERIINELIGKIRAEGRGELDMNHVHRDGSLIPLHVTVKVIEWKGREVFVSIATEMKADISE
jgi:PAS domain S-box-containing protein